MLTNNYKHKFILNLLGYIHNLKWFFFFISCSKNLNEHLLLKNFQRSMHWVKQHSQILNHLWGKRTWTLNMVCKLIYYWFFKSCSIETRKILNFCRKIERYLKWDERFFIFLKRWKISKTYLMKTIFPWS